MLNRPTKDIDIVTLGDGIELANSLAKHLNVSKVSVFKNFGTAMINYGDVEIQFVGARKAILKTQEIHQLNLEPLMMIKMKRFYNKRISNSS